MSAEDRAREDYLLLVLADSNLPTGGFVASAGLEACWSHGLLRQWPQGASATARSYSSDHAAAGLVAFLQSALDTYARSVAGFIHDVHRVASTYVKDEAPALLKFEATTAGIAALDETYDVMLLNHVAQRASRAQGVALLTLHSKSFAALSQEHSPEQARATELLRQLKKQIRLGTLHGHLPICFAAFMAALGISNATRVLEVHLFLQARAILSSAVRLNIVGPYQMHRILAFDAKVIIDDAVSRSRDCTTGTVSSNDATSSIGANGTEHTNSDESAMSKKAHDETKDDEWDWTWPEEGAWTTSGGAHAPKTTWPLGDLVQGRHDQLHSRLFNS